MNAEPETNVTSDELSARLDLVLITGLSGAGKSTAMAVFEDEGYFCVDRLPAKMIGPLVGLYTHKGLKAKRAALVSDVGAGDYFEQLAQMLDGLSAGGVHCRVLFLEASEAALAARFKEACRQHPIAQDMAAGIARERELLASLRQRADLVIDTTRLSAAALRRKLAAEMLAARAPQPLAVTFESFGFKHGALREANLLFDVRFLPNPYEEPELRPLSGREQPIVSYLNRDGALERFYERLDGLLDYLLPRYLAEGRSRLVLGVGCAGGRRRSVAVVEHLGARYGPERRYLVDVSHRDIEHAG